MGSHGCCCPEDGSLYVLDECLGVLRSGRLEDASPTLVGFNWINDLVCAALGPTTRMIPEEICSVLGPSPAFTSGASYDEFTVRMPLSSTTMNLFLDTAITAMSALMIVMLVPSGRYLGLISYLLDLTSSQAVVMGWAPLVSASFLFIWACNWVGAIIPWSFIEIPSGELAAPTNDINVTTFLAL